MPQEHQNKSKLIKIKTKISRKLNLLIEGDGYETVNIKGVSKDAKIYDVRSTPCTIIFILFFFLRFYINND